MGGQENDAMNVRSFTVVTSVLFAVLMVAPIVVVQAPQPIWWFDEEDGSIHWRADQTVGFVVDLDGDHTTGATSNHWWTAEYGEVASLGVVNITIRDGSILRRYGWVARIGTLKIDKNPTQPFWEWHIRETEFGDVTEWFCYRITKKKAPTNFHVILYASDGANRLPITLPFWYSEDNGLTWNEYNP